MSDHPEFDEPQSHPYEAIVRYERRWPADQFNDLSIELACFLEGLKPEDGGLGKAEHFWRVAAILWPETSSKPFIRHPWAEKMIEEACRHQYLSVSGPGNCGKTDAFAVWAIVCWIADPVNTAVLVTSTSLKESRKRIWGAITDYWLACDGLPGKLVDSLGMIRYVDAASGKRGSDRSAISLISGEKKHEKKSIGKLIGIHNKRVIVIGDELPELSPSILEAVKTNVSKNPIFQIVGIGNPNSIFDPHGELSTPKNGWSSINVFSEEWETELGYAIRFDGERSPNILAGEIIYPWLPTVASRDQSIRDNGENSLGHWRMFRGFWCPEGTSHGIYTENDIAAYGGNEKRVFWSEEPIGVAGLDQAFSNGGDKSIAYFAKFGTNTDGIQVLLFTDYVMLSEDRNDTTPRSQQIAARYKSECVKRGILPHHAGYDHTGPGAPFGDVLAEVWSPDIYRAQFGGAPTEIPVGLVGTLPASKKYANRVSEIWFVGRDFLRAGQIKGISADLAREMVARRHHEGGTVRRGDYVLECVESKKDMRKRTGFSPDRADAAFIILDLCRSRLKFRANLARPMSKMRASRWDKFREQQQEVEAASPRQLVGSMNELRNAQSRARRLMEAQFMFDEETVPGLL